MMALDRSPESFFPTNEFYIFVPLVRTCDPPGGASFDPKGHHMNKMDRGLQGDATYQNLSSIPSSFREEEVCLRCSYVPTCDPVVGSVLTPKESYE